MKRKRYKPKTKQAIIEAVQQARKGGGKWASAYEAAKKAGYKGSSPGLYQLIRVSGGKRKKKTNTMAVAKQTTAKSSTDSILANLAAHIDKAVNDRLAQVIEALESMR